VVPEQSAIHSVADLKGKRVGLNKGSDVNYLLVAALEKAGLSYKDITPVYLPPADARAAFQRGAIDAWVIWDPFLAEVETNAKARQIRNAEGLVPHYTFYLASRKFADTYPETAKQVVDELGKLSAWANSHQDEAAGLLSTSTGLDKAIWLKTLARLPYGAERMTPAVYNEQQALADTFTRIGLLPVKVDVRSATWSLDKPCFPGGGRHCAPVADGLPRRFLTIANLPDKGRRLTVHQPVSDIARLVNHRIMRGDRPRIAPVAIQRQTGSRIRRPEGIKQLRRRPRDPVAGDHLRLRRFHFRQLVAPGDQRFVVADVRHIGLLQRFRGLQDRGPGRPCPAADLPNDLQNLSVIARHGGVAVAVHPGACLTPCAASRSTARPMPARVASSTCW
jgi:sulfonate transport system substrate-binding protein